GRSEDLSPALRLRRRLARRARAPRAAAPPRTARRRSHSRHAAQVEAWRCDVPQVESVRQSGSPARGAETHQARGCLDVASVQYYGTGRRKTSTARVFLRPGSGAISVNHKTFEVFFPTEA